MKKTNKEKQEKNTESEEQPENSENSENSENVEKNSVNMESEEEIETQDSHDENKNEKNQDKAVKKKRSVFDNLKYNKDIDQANAGAGFIGLIGFAGLFFVSIIFFVTENFFIAMFAISLALLIYVTGLDLARLIVSSITIFISSKHVVPKASYLQETFLALKSILTIRRDKKGNVVIGTIETDDDLILPDNSLSRDVKQVIDDEKGFDYVEYVVHSYYVECHELYESSNSNLEFVSSSMPLFGLIGTIVGLIAMFDSLGSDVTVESLAPQLALALKTTLYGAIFSSVYKIIATRFERRMTDLDYDYDTFCRALYVIVENGNKIIKSL